MLFIACRHIWNLAKVVELEVPDAMNKKDSCNGVDSIRLVALLIEAM